MLKVPDETAQAFPIREVVLAEVWRNGGLGVVVARAELAVVFACTQDITPIMRQLKVGHIAPVHGHARDVPKPLVSRCLGHFASSVDDSALGALSLARRSMHS